MRLIVVSPDAIMRPKTPGRRCIGVAQTTNVVGGAGGNGFGRSGPRLDSPASVGGSAVMPLSLEDHPPQSLPAKCLMLGIQ
jgi:hypothetical protein